jgi:DNA-binding transcriptional LysR family regulator
VIDRLACFDTFVRVAERGGFAAAARDLCLSPATVTHQIQSRENRLGAPLFNRTTRNCSLTEAGRVFYERCVRILMDIKEAETLAANLHATARGTIRLNSSPTLTSCLTALIVEFVSQHPGVSFELIATDEMGSLVEHGFDLAIRAGVLPDSNLITRRLGSASWMACAAPDYLARFGYPTTPAELTRHNCLTCAPLLSSLRRKTTVFRPGI